MERPKLEVAEVFRRYGPAYRQEHAGSLARGQRRVMSAIELCRTAALGGHEESCDACGHRRFAYNSCRNRHCPKCQSARLRWLEARQAELLHVPYFHVVFTLPEEIAAMAWRTSRSSTASCSKQLPRRSQIAAHPQHLGAEIGFLAVLHTWGQNLMLHPHLHCVVPAGGFSADGQQWIEGRANFFLPVRVLSCLSRRSSSTKQAFLAGQLHFFPPQGLRRPAFERLLDQSVRTDWVVYAKPPFGGPEQVLKYLARYTHRMAISNSPTQALTAGASPSSGRITPTTTGRSP